MPMPMHCDNQATIFIVGNLAFHERTKHIEIDCHFIRDKVLMGVIFTPHVSSSLEARPKFWDTNSPMMADANRYRCLLGKPIYLTVIYLDITYVVSVLSQFMHEPLMVHWDGALRVLAYIKCALGEGLIYRRHDHLRIEAYSNAGYAGDKGDRKSSTGYCTYIGGNLVTWCSWKQKVVSCLSAEAEYRAMAATTREMVWL